MSAARPPAGPAVAWKAIAVAVAVAAGTMAVPGCGASQYQRVGCDSKSNQAIFPLEAQAVPSATLIPCAGPLPGGWSVAGFEVRSGLAQFWLDSDQAGARAAEVTLTQTCDVAGATRLPRATVDGQTTVQRYEVPAAREPHATVRYYLFTGGCVTYRLSFTRQTAPVLAGQASQLLGFDPRWWFVNAIRRDQGLTLCGAYAPPCPG